MAKLIFLDTEATGNEPQKDRLCQVCYRVGPEGETRVEYFKPPVPISVKAMSITHITNKMVEGKEAFADSQFKKDLQTLLDEGILVAHTALFDIAMLKAEGMEVPRFIDTLRVVRHLDPEMKIPEHNLQYLRYFLELEVPGTAHDAEGDVNVLVALYERLFKKIRENEDSDEAAIEQMVEVSARPTLFKYMVFGKYKGKALEEVVETDRRYLEWLLGSMTANGEADTDEDLIYTLKHYLGA
jgi:DNA polymerase III epsilon subunit-like protein